MSIDGMQFGFMLRMTDASFHTAPLSVVGEEI